MKKFKYTKVCYFLERAKRFFERVRMSDTKYQIMKDESRMYRDMLSAIDYNYHLDYEDVRDANGALITQVIKAKIETMDINIVEMLSKGGIVFNKDRVKLNVTGL